MVFGGSMGIGKAIVQILEEAGSTVHSVSRRSGCDITYHAQVASTIDGLMREWVFRTSLYFGTHMHAPSEA